MIVAHHFSVHGGFSYSNDQLLNKIFLLFFGSGGKVGVSVFVLISGYFLVRNGFALKKLGRYIVQVWGYSLVVLGVTFCLQLPHGSGRELIRYLLPFGYMNWFAHAYLLLFLLTPFINKMLLHLGKILFQRFLMLGFSLWYLIPTITGLLGLHMDMEGSILMDFIFLYAVGAYIRLHEMDFYVKNAAWKTVGCYIAIVFFDLLCDWLHLRDVRGNLFYFADINSALMLITSFYLFMVFKQLHLRHNYLINRIAATTFGVYLIHDSNLLRHFIWRDILQVNCWEENPFLPVYAIITVMFVFVLCGTIDFLRIQFLESFYNRWIDRILPK